MALAKDNSFNNVQIPLPDLECQADLVQYHRIDTLLYCPNAWALRHVFVNQETGETIRARCNRWDCLYCGPRKVDQWRQLVKAAEPTLFLTLSKSGKTVEEAARALTVFMRFLRRGSKGKGPNKVGAREAYPVEYFAVLERHSNFAENGFHWHLLLKGVDYLPYKEVIQPAWRSATHEQAEIGHIEAIRNPKAIGYVTKYLTKSVTAGEKGVRVVQRKQKMARLLPEEDSLHVTYENRDGAQVPLLQPSAYTLDLDEKKQVMMDEEVTTIEDFSRARRIRYSRHFFPESVTDLRARLFAEVEQEAMEPAGNDKPRETEDEEEGDKRSVWGLVEQAEFTRDTEEYKRRRREALLSTLEDIRSGQRNLSRRVINIWAYQRSELKRSR